VFDKNKFDHTLLVEFCSVVERAINYMHTGNTAVIATTVMNPLWVGRALVKDGFPSLNSDFVDIANPEHIQIKGDIWPFNKLLHRPHSSSQRSHLLTYGEPHFNVSLHCLPNLVGRNPAHPHMSTCGGGGSTGRYVTHVGVIPRVSRT
jgi:hypothetical protein